MKVPTIFHLALLWWWPAATIGDNARTCSIFPTSLYKNTWASPANCEYTVLALLWDRVAVMMPWCYQTESSKHIFDERTLCQYKFGLIMASYERVCCYSRIVLLLVLVLVFSHKKSSISVYLGAQKGKSWNSRPEMNLFISYEIWSYP